MISTVAARGIQKEKHVAVIIRGTYRSLHGKLGGVDCIVNTKLLREIEWYIRLTKQYEGKNYIYGHFKHDWTGLIFQRDTSITVWKDYCKNVFRIPEERLHNCFSSAKAFSGNTHDTLQSNEIVLCPYAKSVKLLPDLFWLDLSEQLKNSGYKVYTNIAGQEKIIEGTMPLHCGLNRFCEMLEGSAGCISLRSGICDLLAVYSITNLFIINRPGFISDMPMDDTAENWDVTYLRDCGVYNFMFDESNAKSLVREIVQCVQQRKKTADET